MHKLRGGIGIVTEGMVWLGDSGEGGENIKRRKQEKRVGGKGLAERCAQSSW